VFEGHTATVEDVIWAPGSDHLAASVGDDAQMLFWDARAGRAPVAVVGEAHGRHDNKGRATIDIHTLDWSAVQEHLVATGAADGSLRVWDRRKLGAGGEGGSAPLKAFTFHRDAIMRVEWHPTASVRGRGGVGRERPCTCQ
jgi:histone-binding protein RBBP4